jgi:hypothetical protein
MESPRRSAPEAPQYRITFFYGPAPAEDRPACLCCTFNVKKRSWKGGVQVAVEVDERQVARAQVVTGFEPWVRRIGATLLDAERADYESRARDLFVQHLCGLKLDLAIESGLQQENRRIAAEAFVRELDEAAPMRKERLLAAILTELDLPGYGGV